MHAIDGMACAKRGCDNRGKLGLTIVGHGSFPTKWGRRWRYRCAACAGTVSTNTGTAYSGLRCARRACDQVASLRVEGVSISATARVTGHSRTVQKLDRGVDGRSCITLLTESRRATSHRAAGGTGRDHGVAGPSTAAGSGDCRAPGDSVRGGRARRTRGRRDAASPRRSGHCQVNSPPGTMPG